MQSIEIWRIADWICSDYSVSNLGRVRRESTGRIVRQSYAGNYLKVGLRLGHLSYKTLHVHRLVARTWVSGYADGLEVNHKNGVTSDNRPENLEWVTPGQNSRHAVSCGLVKRRKLTNGQAANLRELYSRGKSFTDLGRLFGISRTAARNIALNKQYRYEIQEAC